MNDPDATGIPGFHGRDEELDWLYGLFKESVCSRTPNFAVVVAESGLGKSRLVQALYQKLARDPEWDPGDFWPDAFGDDEGRSLRVNPAFDADHKPKAPPKFLWLGMRWEDPQGRNRADVLCPLPNVKEQLSRCLEVTLEQAGGWGKAKEVVRRLFPFNLYQLSDMGFDVLVDHAGILEYVVPGAGAITKAVKGVTGLKDTVADAEGKAQKNAGDQLLEYLRGLMGVDEPVPTVLWLDDAQWIDEATVAFLRELLSKAKPGERRKGWPLLVVATHWEREWNEARGAGGEAGKGLALFEDPILGGGRGAQVRRLDKSTKGPLGGLLKELLPGLTEGQRALLLEKADGNFLTMTENVGYLREDEALNFEDGTYRRGLTDEAVEDVEDWESDREKRVEQRFRKLGVEHRKVLGWGAASPLGSRFVEEVVVRFAEAEGGVDKPRERLAKCAVPFAVLTGGGAPPPGSPPRPLREFRDRAYFLAANKFFDKRLKGGREALDGPVREVLSGWVNACFGADGEREDGHGESPLGLVSATERVEVLEAACEALPLDVDGDWSDGSSAAGLRAACLLVLECARSGLWDRCRMAGEALEGVGWGAVPVKVLRQGFRWALTLVLHQAHAFKAAHGVAMHIAERCRAEAEEVGGPESRTALAGSLNSLGAVQQGRGDLDGAADSHREALRIRRALADEVGDPESRALLATSLNNLGLVQQGRGDLDGAADSHREALGIWRALAEEVGGPESRPALALSLNNLGHVQQERGDLDGAADSHREALGILRALAEEVGGPESRWALALSLNNLGVVQRSRGDLEGAADSHREALGIWRALAEEVGGPESRTMLAASLNNLGVVQESRGDLEGAADSHREALGIRRALAEEVGGPASRSDLANSLNNLSFLQESRGDLDAATDSLREALGILRALAEEVGGPESRPALALSLDNLGFLQRRRGDLEGAADSHREELGIRRALAEEVGGPESRSNLALSLSNLGLFQESRGDLEGAADSHREALGILRALAEEVGGPESRSALAASLDNLGFLQRRRGDLEGAADSHREELGIRRALAEEVGGPESRSNLAMSLSNLGWVQRRRGDLEGAADSHRDALGIRRTLAEEVGGPESRSALATSLNNLGLFQESRGDLEGAADSLRDALGIRRALAEEVGGPESRSALALSLNNLGLVQQGRGDWDGAAESLREALGIRQALWDESGDPVHLQAIAQLKARLDEVVPHFWTVG